MGRRDRTRGMLISSTKKMHFFPAGAPSRFFRFFSSFDSMACCVISDKVCALKFMNVGTTAKSTFVRIRLLETATDSGP